MSRSGRYDRLTPSSVPQAETHEAPQELQIQTEPRDEEEDVLHIAA